MMDARVLEQHKENIQPIHTGRPASKLGKALASASRRSSISKQRDRFEERLQSDEIDDPLQEFVDYIAWTHNNFPQGANIESGLLGLLERCTSEFRDTAHYKNDPRYLKVWLEYAQYSDSPRDIFVYLARKNIGSQLALYYEEFAKLLESKGKIADAREVYTIGLERGAIPATRLARTFDSFKSRVSSQELLSQSLIRDVMIVKRPSASTISGVDNSSAKRPKLTVLNDPHEMTIRDTAFSRDAAPNLTHFNFSRKENKIAAKSWNGEILRQNTQDAESERKTSRFEVFRDEHSFEATGFELRKEGNEICTIIRQAGKPTERLCVNMSLLYPSALEEYCPAELLVSARNLKSGEPVVPQRQEILNPGTPYVEQDNTFTIPLRDDTTQKLKSPTMTMFSRITTNEVLEMFNEAASKYKSDEDTDVESQESTNYNGFTTEVLKIDNGNDAANKLISGTKTPPTDHSDSERGSSPFLDQPALNNDVVH